MRPPVGSKRRFFRGRFLEHPGTAQVGTTLSLDAGNHHYCGILTVTDHAGCYLLRGEALSSTKEDDDFVVVELVGSDVTGVSEEVQASRIGHLYPDIE